MGQMNLSARGYHRVLKLARTIADLAGCEQIQAAHLAKALQYGPKMMQERSPRADLVPLRPLIYDAAVWPEDGSVARTAKTASLFSALACHCASLVTLVLNCCLFNRESEIVD